MPVCSISFSFPSSRAELANPAGIPMAPRSRHNRHVYQIPANFDVLGYIPGLSIITGIFRIIVGSMCCPFNPVWSIYQITRGCLEVSCLGWVYIFFDGNWVRVNR